MSQVSTIPEVLSMRDDETVYAFKAAVKSATPFYPAVDETKQNFQILTLSAGGKEIKAVLRNRDEFPKAWVGKMTYFLANHGQKGWSGLKAKDNDYKGKVERVLWVTRTAEVLLAVDYESRGNQGGDDDDQVPGAEAPQRRRPPASREASPPESKMATDEVKKMLWKSHNLMRYCLRVAEYDRECYEEDFGKQMTDAQFQAVVSTHYINCKPAMDLLPGKAMSFPPTEYAKAKRAKEAEIEAAKQPPAAAPPPQQSPEQEPEPDYERFERPEPANADAF